MSVQFNVSDEMKQRNSGVMETGLNLYPQAQHLKHFKRSWLM